MKNQDNLRLALILVLLLIGFYLMKPAGMDLHPMRSFFGHPYRARPIFNY